MAPTRRVIAASLGKMPTTSVRRLISPLTRSSGLVTGMMLAALPSPARSRSLRMVRPSGLRGAGSMKRGQADAYDEPRARVSSWPPLRPARLRLERGSVGVVQPTAPLANSWRGSDEARDRHGHPPHLRGGGVLARRTAALVRAGRHDPRGARGLWPQPGEGRRG